MKPESTARNMAMTADIISHTLTKGGGVVVCAVTEDATGFITHYAGRNTPRSMAHMALTLLRQAHDDLISRDQSTPLDQDDEDFLTDLAGIINDLEFYAEPEAAA
jgi:hypothetical protein